MVIVQICDNLCDAVVFCKDLMKEGFHDKMIDTALSHAKFS